MHIINSIDEIYDKYMRRNEAICLLLFYFVVLEAISLLDQSWQNHAAVFILSFLVELLTLP